MNNQVIKNKSRLFVILYYYVTLKNYMHESYLQFKLYTKEFAKPYVYLSIKVHQLECMSFGNNGLI